jgi:cbb3-type cytochrome oxidase subunit 3
MRLSDIMSSMHLGTYAEVALVIFMLVFAMIAVHVFRRGNAAAWQHASQLPLEPELPAAAPVEAARDSTPNADP